jgi:hypothetical protein
MVSVASEVYAWYSAAESTGEPYRAELRFVSDLDTPAAMQLVLSAVDDLMDAVAGEQLQQDAQEFYPGIWSVLELDGCPVIWVEDEPTDFRAILTRFLRTLERFGANARLDLAVTADGSAPG